MHLAHAEGQRCNVLDGVLVVVLLKYKLVRVVEAAAAALLGLVDVDEHFVEHEVQKVLIGAEEFYKLLSLDLGELLDLLWGASLDYSHVGLEELVVSAAAADYGLASLRHD